MKRPRLETIRRFASRVPPVAGAILFLAFVCGDESGSAARKRTNPTDAGFLFGVEYAVPGLAKIYSSTGVHAAKPTPSLITWKHIQPKLNAPFKWESVDRLVREYQQAGFDTLSMIISAESPWASRKITLLSKDTRPRESYESEYKLFVKSVVERYDNDGYADMPGLRHAIRYWGIEREFSGRNGRGHWPGSGSDYVELLKLAYPAVKEADPEAKVMLVGLLMWDVFNGDPNSSEAERRVLAPPYMGASKETRDVPALLDAHAFFDIVDLHSIGDYTEIPSMVRWIRKELAKRGVSKPIVIGDSFPMSPLVAYGIESCDEETWAAKPFHPVTEHTRCSAVEILQARRKEKDPKFEESRKWIEREVAIGLVKKSVVAASEGLMGINVGNMEDWPAVNAGASAFMGLMDVNVDFREIREGDPVIKAFRRHSSQRPGFHALTMLMDRVGQFGKARRIPIKGPFRIYEFWRLGKRTLVIWMEDGHFYPPDRPEPKRKLNILWVQSKAMMVKTPTTRDHKDPKPTPARIQDGRITLELDRTPVFVYAP